MQHHRPRSIAAVGVVVAALVAVPAVAHAASLTAVTSFGSNPGSLAMYEYVPDGLAADRPIVVVLHGCSQTAADMENAGWNTLADTYRFAVLYPQQTSTNNVLECFDWYSTTDETRAQGEAQSIASMVDSLTTTASSDPTRVYVMGFSAGAAYASILLATYPDVFAAGSLIAGIPYRCATDLTATTACEEMPTGSQQTATAWGALVRAGDTAFTGAWPRVQIWQGTSDTTVYPANAGELVKQWTNVHGIDQTATATTTIGTATRTQYEAAGAVVVEEYLVTGMPHGVAIGTDALGACPSTAGTYFVDEQICTTLRAAEFFGVLGSGSGSGSGGSNDAGIGADPDAGTGPGETTSNNNGGCCAAGDSRGSASGFALALLVMLATMRRRRT